MPSANVSQVAKFVNLDERRVQQLVKEGVFPRARRGQYNLSKCAAAYIRYLQSVLEKKGVRLGDGIVSLNERDERVRLLKTEADLKEIELFREREQLVTIDDVEKEMAELALTTKARVMSVAARVAPELVGETSRIMIQAKLEKHLKEALLQLEKMEKVETVSAG